jgi:hypothetical protein
MLSFTGWATGSRWKYLVVLLPLGVIGMYVAVTMWMNANKIAALESQVEIAKEREKNLTVQKKEASLEGEKATLDKQIALTQQSIAAATAMRAGAQEEYDAACKSIDAISSFAGVDALFRKRDGGGPSS